MEKTKKNGILKTAACIFGGTMLMTCILGGTLAKYVSDAKTTQASMTAATWDVLLNGEDWDTATFDDLTFTDIHSSTSGTAEIPNKPAPGTWGYETITIKNNSEVAAKITVTQGADATNVSNSGLSLAVFTGSDPINGEMITGDLGTLATDGVVIEPQSEKVVYVGYNWKFGTGDTDEKDTELAGSEINFNTLTLKAEQAEHKNA